MAKSPTEKISELRTEVEVLSERIEVQWREINTLTAEHKATSAKVQELSQELRLLVHRLDEHLERTEEWERRRWGLAGLLVGAILTFTANLIVALVRRG